MALRAQAIILVLLVFMSIPLLSQEGRDFMILDGSLVNLDTAQWRGSIKYVIVHRGHVLSPEIAKDGRLPDPWIVTTVSSDEWGHIEYLRAVDPEEIGVSLEAARVAGELRDASKGDVLIVGAAELDSLARMYMFASDIRSIWFDSRDRRTLEELFDLRWALSSTDRFLILTGLASRDRAVVHLYYPQQKTVSPFLRLSSEATRQIPVLLRLLGSGEIPAAVHLRLSFSGKALKANESEIERLYRATEALRISFLAEGPVRRLLFIPGEIQVDASGAVFLTGRVPREALESRLIRVEADGQTFRFVSDVGEFSDSYVWEVPGCCGSSIEVPLRLLDISGGTLLHSQSMWIHQLTLPPDVRSKDLARLLARHRHEGLKAEAGSIPQLLVHPVRYLETIGSRKGRAVFGSPASRQVMVAQGFAQLNHSLDELWSRIEACRQISLRESVVVAVVGSVRSGRQGKSLLAAYVREYFQMKQQKSGSEVLFIEGSEVSDNTHLTRRLDFVIAPSGRRGIDEAQPEQRN
jgi:hypothetical protein